MRNASPPQYTGSMKWILATLLLTACASEQGLMPVGKTNSATSVNDLFEVEQGMPMREVKTQKFFPKKCELARSRPYFSKTEYECTDDN